MISFTFPTLISSLLVKLGMLKGEKLPYFNNSMGLNLVNFNKLSANSSISGTTNGSGSSNNKVTRRRAHEICGKSTKVFIRNLFAFYFKSEDIIKKKKSEKSKNSSPRTHRQAAINESRQRATLPKL